MTRIILVLKLAALILAIGITALSAFAYYERYYRWRGCFNELGRCFDSETATVYLEQAGIVWVFFVMIGAMVAALLCRSLWRNRKC